MKKVFDESPVPPEHPTVKLADTTVMAGEPEEVTEAHHEVARFYHGMTGFRPARYPDGAVEMKFTQGEESLATIIRESGDMDQLGRLREAIEKGKKISSGTRRKLIRLIDYRAAELLKS